MKKKKKTIYLLSFALLFVVLARGIFAYASSKNNSVVDNHLHVATLEGDIEEKGFTPKTNIPIGGKKSKDIKIKNSGNTALFVRVMVFPQIKIPFTDSEGKASPKLLPANIGKEIEAEMGTNWEAGEDGYYYFKTKVLPDEKTSSLFTEVKLADDLSDEYKGAEFDIQVKSETVTAANHQYRKVWWNLDEDTAPTEMKLAIIDTELDSLLRKP